MGVTACSKAQSAFRISHPTCVPLDGESLSLVKKNPRRQMQTQRMDSSISDSQSKTTHEREELALKGILVWTGKVGMFLLAAVAGGLLGRNYNSANAVHAQEQTDAYANCIVAVPKAWGEFKGGSAFGLAFEDQTGTLRFMLHPPCGSINTPTEYRGVDLKVIRK